MRFFSILCYIIGLGTLPFAFEQASKPSAIPIAAVAGAFVIPALFIWWGAILWKKSKPPDTE
jgi:hypothetical protein